MWLSLEAGLTLLNRLSENAGLAQNDGDRVFRAFPRPEDLAPMPLRDFRKLGFSMNKALALKSLSESILEGNFDPESICLVSDQEAIERLLQIRGIGRWTAEYVVLRGIGRYSLFPGDDVGARNKLAGWLRLKGPMDYERVHKTLGFLGPYRGLLYFHLLLGRLEEAGCIQAGPNPRSKSAHAARSDAKVTTSPTNNTRSLEGRTSVAQGRRYQP